MKLKDWINSKKISDAEFARMLGVTTSAVSRWINGSRIPNIQFLQAIEELTKGKVRPQDWYK